MPGVDVPEGHRWYGERTPRYRVEFRRPPSAGRRKRPRPCRRYSDYRRGPGGCKATRAATCCDGGCSSPTWAALCVAFLLVELVGGLDGGPNPSLGFDLLLLAMAIPMWVLLLRVYGVYHVDSRRADHGLAEDVAPLSPDDRSMELERSPCLLRRAASATWRYRSSSSSGFSPSGSFSPSVRRHARGLAGEPGTSRTRWSWAPQRSPVRAIITKILRHPEYGVNVVASMSR